MKTAASHVALALICCLLWARPCLCDHLPSYAACVNENGFIVVNITPAAELNVGIDVASIGGHLLPVSDPTPFGTVLVSNKNAVTLINFPESITIDGDVVTPIGWDGQVDPASDLRGSLSFQGDGAPRGFSVIGYCGDKLAGDFNLDAVVNHLDIDMLGLEIGVGTHDASFDLTSDSLVNQDDLDLFLGGNIITNGNKLNGDADFSGFVDLVDFLALSSNFGQDGKKWSGGDFVVNGRVEFDDFLTLSVNCCNNSKLVELDLSNNQLTSIESGAFEGLSNLRQLYLEDNELTMLNLAAATLASLEQCDPLSFCVDGSQVTELILDNALLNAGSFNAIIGETHSLTNASLVGLELSDSNPNNLGTLLGIETLSNVRVNQMLFDLYADEFNAFAAMPGSVVTVIAEADCSVDGMLDVLGLACQTDPTQLMQLQDQSGVLPGDLNGVNGVDVNDFLKLVVNFGLPAANYGEGDINLDGQTDFTDFLLLSANDSG